jgi:hypothetical protein
MCTGFEIAGLAAAIGGTYLQTQAADDAADDQRRIINQADEATKKINKQKIETTQNFAADNFDPAKREQRYEEAATKNESSLVDALLKASDGEVSQATEGRVSSDYVRGKASANAGAASDIMKRAKLMARQNANGLMYQNESLKGGELSSDLAGLGYSSNNVNRMAGNDVSAAANKGSLIGGLLSGASPMIATYKPGSSMIPGMTAKK